MATTESHLNPIRSGRLSEGSSGKLREYWHPSGDSDSCFLPGCADSLLARRKLRFRWCMRKLALLTLVLGCFWASAQSKPPWQTALPPAGSAAIAAGKTAKVGPPGSTDLRSNAPRAPEPIVIGFVGGFVKRNDQKHQEIQFAARIRERYTDVHAEVYTNHQGTLAFQQILTLLDTNHDGVLTASEKQQARIILYGHSWGASETVDLARELGKDGIPVLLTIQIDSITKPGQQDSVIPFNVVSAVNFYQVHGLLHGSTAIRAADPARTKIIGNFRMTYKAHQVRCNEYPWYSRLFTGPHIAIESDPRVWNHIGSLVDAELAPDPPESQHLPAVSSLR
jgi:hypothetical protein